MKTILEYIARRDWETDAKQARLFVQLVAGAPSFSVPVECDDNGVADKVSLVQALRAVADRLAAE
jgi:hypothetical protein